MLCSVQLSKLVTVEHVPLHVTFLSVNTSLYELSFNEPS